MTLLHRLGGPALALIVFAAGCTCTDAPEQDPRDSEVALQPEAAGPSPEDAAPHAQQASEAGPTPEEDDGDPMQAHRDTDEALLELLELKRVEGQEEKKFARLVSKTFGIKGPGRSNQGNKRMARHTISRGECLRGLKGVVLQTDEQRTQCKGHPNMVPLFRDADPSTAEACIDIFEFPNKACELPVVWIGPTPAGAVCESLGKRLCTQREWVHGCGGDPGGGPSSTYAYGSELDLTACNTNKRAAASGNGPCDPTTIDTAWKTCSTMTEPSGSFPRCRSPFGVFDQHGNVAEIMTRREPDGAKVSQLKGSAWFYVDVARRPDEPGTRQTYSDHCAHDPRWHVEPMRKAWHVNYHLGFRCCVTLK